MGQVRLGQELTDMNNLPVGDDLIKEHVKLLCQDAGPRGEPRYQDLERL